MGLFLQIFGAIILLILAYIAFRVLLLVGKAVLFLYGIKTLGTKTGESPSPATIRLVPDSEGTWDEASAAALAAPLAGLGYQEVGFFDVDEIMGGLRLQAWVHPDLGLYAVIYTSPEAGVWSDVVTKYEDGTSLTYSNSPDGGKLSRRPGDENVVFGGVGTDELHRKMLAERPARPTGRLNAQEFAPDFERAYAEEMASRDSSEEFDAEAVDPGAALFGMIGGKLTRDQMRQVRESMVRKMSDASAKMYEVSAHDLRRKYRQSIAMSDEDWARLEPRLVFVWDRMNVGLLRAVLTEWDGLSERDRLDYFDEEDENGSGLVRRWFAALNAGVSADRRLVKVGEVATDLPGDRSQTADVYERACNTNEPGPQRASTPTATNAT